MRRMRTRRMKMRKTRKTAVRRRKRMEVKRLRLRRDPIEAVEGEAGPPEALALAQAIQEEGHGRSEYSGKDLDLFFAFIEFLGCCFHDTPKDCLFGEKPSSPL